MATNSFFRNYSNKNEQNLLEDLVIESIRIYGLDIVYLTRNIESADDILNEDDMSIFNAAYQMEMYVKTYDGFVGEGDFMSKLGLTIRDEITFTLANRTFERYVTRFLPEKQRPFEGDLIYFPINRKMYKVMHVEHESVFYQLGALQVYDLKCELFEYSNERFETGIPDIDNHYNSIKSEGLTDIDTLKIFDYGADNIKFEEEVNTILDFSEINPFEETIRIPLDYSVSADSTKTSVDSDLATADIEDSI